MSGTVTYPVATPTKGTTIYVVVLAGPIAVQKYFAGTTSKGYLRLTDNIQYARSWHKKNHATCAAIYQNKRLISLTHTVGRTIPKSGSAAATLSLVKAIGGVFFVQEVEQHTHSLLGKLFEVGLGSGNVSNSNK